MAGVWDTKDLDKGKFIIKINGKIQKKLTSRVSKVRRIIKKRSKFLKVDEPIFENLDNDQQGSEDQDQFASPKRNLKEDLRNYELFPNRKIQEKIDKFFTPYNKAFNMERCMNFGEEDKETAKEERKFKTPENCWNKISDLILNRKGDFLRKSLRVLNREKYQKYEEMSKTMKKLKPKRSICKNQSYYRIQSFKDKELSGARRSGVIFSESIIPMRGRQEFQSSQPSTKSILKLPESEQENMLREEEESLVDEQVISRVVSIMKAVNQNSRDNSTETQSSSSSSSTSTNKGKVDHFEQYLKGFIKRDKSRAISSRKNRQENSIMNNMSKKIPVFSPIRSSFSRQIATSKNLPRINTMNGDLKHARKVCKSSKIVESSPLFKSFSLKKIGEDTSPIQIDENKNKDLLLNSPQNRIYKSLRDSSNLRDLNLVKKNEPRLDLVSSKKILPSMQKTKKNDQSHKKRDLQIKDIPVQNLGTLAKYAKSRRLSISVKASETTSSSKGISQINSPANINEAYSKKPLWTQKKRRRPRGGASSTNARKCFDLVDILAMKTKC